jgi:hypothetical protein
MTVRQPHGIVIFTRAVVVAAINFFDGFTLAALQINNDNIKMTAVKDVVHSINTIEKTMTNMTIVLIDVWY